MTLHRFLRIALLPPLLFIAGCDTPYTSQTASQTHVYSRSSQYDPMVDAAPGDERPSVPSVSGVSQEQAIGNANSDIVVPTNNMGGVGRR